MKNYIYFETNNFTGLDFKNYPDIRDERGYTLAKIDFSNAIFIDLEKLIESLLLNEKVIVSGDGLLKTVEILLRYFSLNELNYFIKHNILQFSFKKVPFSFNDMHRKKSKIYEINPSEAKDKDIEEIVWDELKDTGFYNKKLINNLSDKSVLITTKDIVKLPIFTPKVINFEKLNEYELNKIVFTTFLNEFEKLYHIKDFNYDLLMSLYPNNRLNNFFKEQQLNLTIDDNSINIECSSKMVDDDFKFYTSVIGGTVIPFLLQNYISKSISDKQECSSYHGARDFVSWQNNLVNDYQKDKFADLLYINNCIDISKIMEQKNIKSKRFEMEKFRGFYFENRDLNIYDLQRKYFSEIQKEQKNKYGILTSTLLSIIGYNIDPTKSLLVALADVYLKDKFTEKVKKIMHESSTIRLDRIF